MRLWRRRGPVVGVVVPAYGVEAWLDECLASLVAQTHQRWEAVIVDDGSVDRSGEIAQAWAAREPRISVVRQANAGLGAARNTGIAHVGGDYLTFLDSDDVLPPTAYADLVAALESSGSDFATGSLVRWEDGGLTEPRWMRRLHRPLRGARIEERPEILGDVFAPNKLWRRTFWDETGLSWLEGIRYEDQPTTTRSYLAGRFDVLDEIVYHWRIRSGSITQTRDSIDDLSDRWETKHISLASVREHGSADVEAIFVDRVLAGDMWRYFLLAPGASDEWWTLLRTGVLEIWGERSLVHSGLPPVHRLAGWLVEQDHRTEMVALMEWVATLGGPAPRIEGADGLRLDVPPSVIDASVLEEAGKAGALTLRPHER